MGRRRGARVEVPQRGRASFLLSPPCLRRGPTVPSNNTPAGPRLRSKRRSCGLPSEPFSDLHPRAFAWLGVHAQGTAQHLGPLPYRPQANPPRRRGVLDRRARHEKAPDPRDDTSGKAQSFPGRRSSAGLVRLAYSPFLSPGPPSPLSRDSPPCFPPREPSRPPTPFRPVLWPRRPVDPGRSCCRR